MTSLPRTIKFGIAGAIIAVLVLVYVVWHQVMPPTPQILILQREWVANAEFAGDVWASKLAPDYGIAIEVREGSEVIDPVKLVRSGAVQFGVASADRILSENEAGANLIIIAAATYRSPVVFLTQKGMSITGPKDFQGKTVGIQTGTNTELVFHALLRAQDVSAEDVRIVESGWGTTNFETGSIDVLAAFDYDEPVTLTMKNHDYSTIYPEPFGVHYVGTVYFTSKTFANEHPQSVQQFMNALVSGWQHTINDPDEAMNILAASYPAVASNRAKENASLKRGLPYFSGEDGQLLYASPDRWVDMSTDLIAQGKISTFEFATNVDYRFLEKATR